MTEQIQLGTWVVCAGFRNPALLAKMAATLDEVSGRRLILGLEAGWNRAEFEAFGVPRDHRVSRFEEALQVIVPLLRTGEVNFHGTFYSASHCELIPRGPRPQGPELFIAASQPRMLRLAARYADSWDAIGGDADLPASAAELRAKIAPACAEVERDLATLAINGHIRAVYPDAGSLGAHWAAQATPQGAVAERLGAYERLGVAHTFCEFFPATPAALARLTNELQLYRSGALSQSR